MKMNLIKGDAVNFSLSGAEQDENLLAELLDRMWQIACVNKSDDVGQVAQLTRALVPDTQLMAADAALLSGADVDAHIAKPDAAGQLMKGKGARGKLPQCCQQHIAAHPGKGLYPQDLQACLSF
jgi:hypothetical protein